MIMSAKFNFLFLKFFINIKKLKKIKIMRIIIKIIIKEDKKKLEIEALKKILSELP